jgi:ATP-dependent protease ClpP protease subunit
MPNEINLFGPIGNFGSERGITAQQVKTLLAKMDQTQELVVRIDSEGGSVFDGLSIYDAFANYPGPKKAVIESTAFSIASYIAMAFDDVEIAENGYVMIHEPASSVDGTASDMTKSAELLAKLDQSMVAAYSKKTGLSELEARSLMQDETFMNASEALTFGFVNRISSKAVATRIQPAARHTKMPQRVYASLFGERSGGEKSEPTQEKPMSNTQPVAASIKEIKAAHPKMKDSFYIKCLERELPLASVASAAAEELMQENAALQTQCKAMEEELTALRAKAMEIEIDPEPTVDPAVDPNAEADPMVDPNMDPTKAKARNGAKPVARSKSPANGGISATQRWEAAIADAMPAAKTKFKAVAIANRNNPGLREQMLAEANN